MKEEMKKPVFNGKIEAKVVGLSKIENNISEVKEFAIQLNEYYKKTIWTPETIDDAKKEKANVNKFKNKIAEFRKNIIAEYKKPINVFETTAKETEKLLDQTYDAINIQVKNHEDAIKEEIKKMCISYFNECVEEQNIDFITFEQMNMNITLGMKTKSGELTKKAKEEILQFVNNITNDIELINCEQYATEIMVEYKQTLNASQSILNVKKRMEQIEQEKQKQLELEKQKQLENETIEKVNETINDEKLNAPKEETQSVDETLKYMTFKVYGTIEQLRELKNYMIKGGYYYEQQ